MIHNAVIDALLSRASIRQYTDEQPSDEVIETVVRAGQQAPFASQLVSVLLFRGPKNPFDAPLLFTICVDCHKLALFMARRNWQVITNDLALLLFGIQDATLMAENMVTAAASLGLGSCFLGAAPFRARSIVEEYHLPPRVFPLVQLAMGYPAEEPPPRPRYPLSFALFEDAYPDLSAEDLTAAMAAMDEGYLAQDYYLRADLMIPLRGGREETFTFDEYSWTEHISRKWGQWYPDIRQVLKQLAACGFSLEAPPAGDETEPD